MACRFSQRHGVLHLGRECGARGCHAGLPADGAAGAVGGGSIRARYAGGQGRIAGARQQRGAGGRQRIFHGVFDGLVHFTAVAKAHFDLGGVHIHIHPGRVHLDVQRIDRLFLAVQHVFVSTFGRMGEDFVAHKAAVDVAVLLVGAAARRIGQPGAAVDGDAAGSRGALHGDGVGDEVIAQHIAQAAGQRFVAVAVRCHRHGTPLLDQLAVMPDGKAYIRACQGVAAHGLDAVRQFGGIAFEEFAPCRGAEKQFLDLQRGAALACGGAQLTAARFQQPGFVVALQPREDAGFRH